MVSEASALSGSEDLRTQVGQCRASLVSTEFLGIQCKCKLQYLSADH